MTDSLLVSFARAVDRYGERTAIIEGTGDHVTFAELDRRAKALAAGWAARGLGHGDRVLIAMPVGADLYAALAALWSVGAVAVLPEPAMGLSGLRHAVRVGGIKGLCAAGPYRWLRLLLPDLWTKPTFAPGQAQRGPVDARPGAGGDLALISFTSGSTGLPKAIPRSHDFLMAQQRAVVPLLDSDGPEVDLVAFPVFVLINLAAGRTSVLPNWPMRRMDRVTPDSLIGWIRAQDVTRALLPPALCETAAQADLPSDLTTIFTGGGPVFPDLVQRLQARCPDLRIVSVYGSTEAEPIAELEASTVTDADRQAMTKGHGLLAGAPVSTVQVRIIDGEIVVAGPHVNDGYLDPTQDRETKIRERATIWHRTGDAGRLDDQGRLWLLGRTGAVVRTDRGPLHPFAVETAARLWPGVRRAALSASHGAPVLVLEGDGIDLQACHGRAAAFGLTDIRIIAAIPLDRRHRSKVDYPALAKRIG
ncbi:AMP-binding protein [Actibacterium sp. 188UL27-1]|uniref:AMP-binding protein n=1 Tax=Actibacterium sp. 188UL27-1 TaxID=2786961 RepID=UPI001959ED90|nr:AMP-binding protein [Actibacterium sp. 188UL27-1]MBM7067430.1 AMP-binding protein [Actibacterium sp. 188UL27-1]